MTPRLIALLLPIALGACVPAAKAPTSRPAPAALVGPAPTTLPLPPAPDWQDLPLTPGRWSYRQEAGGNSALFGEIGSPPSFVMRCVADERRIVLLRDGGTTGTMIVTTSYSSARLAVVASSGAAIAYIAAIDPLLDRIAFSRGRFTIDLPGSPRLVLPAWAEPARVIEDCRG